MKHIPLGATWIGIGASALLVQGCVWPSHMGGRWGGGITALWWLAIVAFFIYFMYRFRAQPQPGGGGADSALETLRKRYVRGEISKEEFELKKKEIQ